MKKTALFILAALVAAPVMAATHTPAYEKIQTTLYSYVTTAVGFNINAEMLSDMLQARQATVKQVCDLYALDDMVKVAQQEGINLADSFKNMTEDERTRALGMSDLIVRLRTQVDTERAALRALISTAGLMKGQTCPK